MRGVLEVIRPLDSIVAQTREGLFEAPSFSLGVISILALSAFGLVDRSTPSKRSNLARDDGGAGAHRERASCSQRHSDEHHAQDLPSVSGSGKTLGIHATIKPAREVGGDFFNFELVKDDRLFFVIGDVSGKGVHAALFMAVANTLIQTAARAGLTPDEVLGVANRQLSHDNDTCMFVTVFCGVVDLAKGCVTFSNGGHNPPYLLSDDNGVTPMDQAGRYGAWTEPRLRIL